MILASSAPAAQDRRSTRVASARFTAAAALVVLGILAIPTALAASAPAAPALAPSAATTSDLGHAASAPVPAANSSFNPPCYKIYIGICVSIANSTETDIIPPVGSFVAAVEPNATSDLQIIVKSQTRLDWVNAGHSGVDSPLALNVTGVLWNGDPYYSMYSGNVWHSDSATSWWAGPTIVSSNSSGYYYWYGVTISAKSSNNVPNFFPGMTVTWWIALTFNVSGSYVHRESPHFQFTYSGAWPFSPYPGSAQYAGASATFEDINLTVTPRAPNWNDSVTFVLNTTQADALSNATVSSAYVDVTETSPLGLPVANGTIVFPPVSVQNGFGATSVTTVLPATYAQIAGAVVTYRLTVFDVANDQIVTPWSTYVVGANGTFLSGIFVDDLEVFTAPTSVGANAAGTVQLAPGAPVNVTLESRNPGTAINAAAIDYLVSYPLLHETIAYTVPLARNSSTVFHGEIPGQPLGTFVNFTVLAWDFSNRLEISPLFGYTTPDLTTYYPVVEPNSTFFYVLVYDNGSHHWVQGATVQVTGPGNIYNSVGNTTSGIAYPNATTGPFIPLLLPANATYTVTVKDPYFVPASGVPPSSISVNILGVHDLLGTRQTLVQAATYTIVQEGNAILFWLNSTPPQPQSSPPVPGGTVPLAAFIGLAATTATALGLGLWWRQIRERRKAEERRITL